MILVDTSIWVSHLRKGNARLAALLDDGRVLTHPFLIGELACGNLGNRTEILRLLSELPGVQVAESEEVLHLLEKGRLYGQGLGWVDVHLLASCLLTNCALLTFDKALMRAAGALQVSA